MAVKIRLTRRGRKKKAMFDIIVADAKSPRDGRLIEKLGTYNPLTNPATILIQDEKALDWLMKGAQPTNTARRILSYKGLLLKKHLQIGVLKGAITQEQADKKFDEWIKGKEATISSKISSLAKKKAADEKARLEAEKKVNEAKAEALKQKLAAMEEVEAVAEEVEVEEGGEVAVEDQIEETTNTEVEVKDEPEAEVSIDEPMEVEASSEETKEVEPVSEVKEEEPKAEITEELESEEETSTEEKKEEDK